ncbi:MAG: energy transducer TonB [Candidatus Paracaedibacter sp.]
MLESKINAMKDGLWPAGIAALTIHGLMVAAMAFGITPPLGITSPQGTSPQDFRAEVTFLSELEKGASELLTSSFAEEANLKQIKETDEQCLSSRKNQQSRNLSAALYPAPAAQVRLRADTSHRGGGKQPEKVSDSLIFSKSGNPGHPYGEQNEATPIFNPPPLYPNEAKRRGIQGVVLVRLTLTQTGIVDKATALLPRADTLLEDAALTAVHTWRFKPGIKTLEVPIEFKLES